MQPNRLSNQTSPYLLQHSYNPVDWYPWGEEAFRKAREEDKPIFMSIGYSTCHWCHVMEKESFEDVDTAHILNNVFVCIKVDREEHPAVDELYMTACSLYSGNGGWPLSVFLTPGLSPFFVATYIPRDSAFGRTGLKEIAQRIRDLWETKRDAIYDSAAALEEGVKNTYQISGTGLRIDDSVFKKADSRLISRFDNEFGGFLPAPKFPMPHTIIYLLKRYRQTGSKNMLIMAEETLRQMRLGGIWDHVGGGLHRYSTDRKWFLPHFEKMLYDQALSSLAFIEAYDVTNDRFYLETGCEILDYVQRDLCSQSGGFYSAEDADSEGEEGRFYTWEHSELSEILDNDEMLFIEKHYGVSRSGNSIDEATGKKTGRNILAVRPSDDWHKLIRDFEPIRLKLLDKRCYRKRPLMDTKILSSWNGLIISALANGYKHSGKKDYLVAAEKSADFIKTNMTSQDGKLFRGGSGIYDLIPAISQDYAHLITGLILLEKVAPQKGYLEWAEILQVRMISDHYDNESGIFRMLGNQSPLFVNPFDLADSVIPSSNSAAYLNLMELSKMPGRKEWRNIADNIEKSMSSKMTMWPDAFTWFLSFYDLAS